MALPLGTETTRGVPLPRWRAVARTWRLSLYGVLGIVVLAIYCYTPPRWQDWNQDSRFDLTLALVERGTVRIDAYVANTGDYAEFEGHYYSDKAPGLSFLAVPVYAATRAIQGAGLGALTERLADSPALAATLRAGGAGTGRERIDRAVALYLATICCVALPGALAVALLARLVEGLCGCRTAGTLSGAILGLATPWFAYAQAFYGHVPAAACVLAAFALLVRRASGVLGAGRLAAIGGLLGAAVVIEYPAALVGLPIALWAVGLARWRAVGYGALGALPPLALLALYDLAAFGTLLPVGYEHSALWQESHRQGFLSITAPTAAAIWGLTGSPFRGLFFCAPVLLLALPGVWLALRDRRSRAAANVALAGCLGLFLVIAASAMWWGGFAVGPRYLLPALPLLALFVGATIARLNGLRGARRLGGLALVGGLAALSGAIIWLLTLAGQEYPPDSISAPLTDYALPAFRAGDVARNLGMALHLRGAVSLLPPLLIAAIGGLWMVRELTRARP